MSDAYDIDGVTVTPHGGGYYDLTHASLPDGTERVQGKEKAEARAKAIAKDAAPPEGHIPPQGDLTASGDTLQGGAGGDIIKPGDERSAAERNQERAAGLPDPKPADKPADDGAPVVDPEQAAKDAKAAQERDDELTSLKDALAAAQGEVKAANARADELAKAAAPIVTTVTAAAEAAPEAAIPAHVPREYAGQMDDKTKAALKKIGVGVSTIVLEENDSIPPTGLFIGHNGRSYQIKPGEEVDVPDFLISVLDDAVMSAPVVDSSTQKVLGYRNRSKYPYRRVNAKG